MRLSRKSAVCMPAVIVQDSECNNSGENMSQAASKFGIRKFGIEEMRYDLQKS